MNNEILINVSRIIERDSKATTYKYALLRGVIDIILDNSPYIEIYDNKVHIPTGLLIEKWLLYYYPILESPLLIPQINGDNKLSFEEAFKKVIVSYSLMGGISAFYNDISKKGIPDFVRNDFIVLIKQLYKTITTMPMKYIGRSISNDFYSIFKYSKKVNKVKSDFIDIEYLINNFGVFSIPRDYYEIFQLMGSFIGGQDSVLFKWAEFSVKASGKSIDFENVINDVLKSPITERDVIESKKIYNSILKNEGKVYCVWTGKSISKFDVDHLLPFSIWKNNDLWNLLPSNSVINNQKKDKIPSSDMIEKQKDLIIYYWELIYKNCNQRFKKEIQVSLLGNIKFENWQMSAINQLKHNSNYLICKRGFEAWEK